MTDPEQLPPSGAIPPDALEPDPEPAGDDTLSGFRLDARDTLGYAIVNVDDQEGLDFRLLRAADLPAGIALVSSWSKAHDDALWTAVEDLARRVAELEARCGS